MPEASLAVPEAGTWVCMMPRGAEMTKTKLRIFPAIPRNPDSAKYVDELMRIARFSDVNGFAGMLLFTGNDIFVEPWSMAQHILAHTSKSSPLIAVNPIYMHPFTVAKFVSSFALLYHRKVYLNMITGTAISDLRNLGDQHSHEERYSRLSEFIYVVRQLLAGTRPITFNGRFYATNNLQLRPRLPAALMPEFLIAGQSEDARRVSREMGCVMMQMLPPNLEEGIRAPGVNFGIFARPKRDQARREAKLFFRDSMENRELLKYTMENTDSVWKWRLNEAGQTGELHENGYWLLPFLTYQADCPYLVGSYAEIGAKLRRFAEKNVGTIILDVLADEEELRHVCKALALSGVF
jgi:alkanesulfonate monooxygenase